MIVWIRNRFQTPDRYSEMASVTAITATSAIFTLKLKRPVTEAPDGSFMVDGMNFDRYEFYYSPDPDRALHLWHTAENSVSDASGTYSLEVSDLAPATRYYVKSSVKIAPRQVQVYSMSFSASILEFETPQ
jgi:hypothetical protein